MKSKIQREAAHELRAAARVKKRHLVEAALGACVGAGVLYLSYLASKNVIDSEHAVGIWLTWFSIFTFLAGLALVGICAIWLGSIWYALSEE